MPESTTLYVGMDVHQESIAVAYVARDHDAHVMDLGTNGPRHVAIARELVGCRWAMATQLPVTPPPMDDHGPQH
jgi:hypothetical protein